MTEKGLDDRTRRINTALITVASAVAVIAVIAVPLALARGNDDGGRGPAYPTAAPTPSASPAPNPDPSPSRNLNPSRRPCRKCRWRTSSR